MSVMKNSNLQTKPIPLPEEIVAHLSLAIKGNDHIKQMLACAAYAHLLRCNSSSKSIRSAQSPENCLIAGPTGCGKSSMIQRLSDYLNLPVVSVLTSSLSPSGYKGKTCNDALEQIEEAAVDSGYTLPTICVWDEFDKVACSPSELSHARSEAGVYKRMTQTDMLGIMSGVKLTDRPLLDLNKILHIACGAFSLGARTQNRRDIGFHVVAGQSIDQPSNHVSPEAFIQAGLIPELVGRYPRLGLMGKPDLSTIREIITNSVTSPYRQKIWHFEQHGTRLRFDSAAIDELAEMVSKHPTGVRALQLVLTRILGELEYEITKTGTKPIEEIRFCRDAVTGLKDPVIIRSSVIRPYQHPATPNTETDTDGDLTIY